MIVCDICSMSEPNSTCTCCNEPFVVCDDCKKEEDWRKNIIAEHTCKDEDE